MPEVSEPVKEAQQKLRELSKKIPDVEFLASPSQVRIDRLKLERTTMLKEYEQAQKKFQADHAAIEELVRRIKTTGNPSAAKLADVRNKMDRLHIDTRKTTMLANNAEKLKQKIDLYEEYLKASNKHTVLTNQEETASFLKDISGKVHEQLEKRERQRELWRTMETAYYQEKANAGQYKEAHWRLINNEVTENKEADVLRLQSNDLGLAKMAQGTYHVTCFGDGPVKHKYEGEVVLDGDGNMHLSKVPENFNHRMALYRTMLQTCGMGIGAGIVTIDFPYLKDPKNLEELSVKEVTSLLQIAKEEGRMVIPGENLQKWADNLKANHPNDYRKYALLLKETELSYQQRAQVHREARAIQTIPLLKEMNQDFQNRVNRITAEPSEVEVKQLNEMMQIVSEQLKTVDVDMTLAQPNGALKQKYDEEVGKIQKTVATLGDKLGNVADESIKEQYQKLSLQVKELYNMTNVEAAPKHTLGG